MNTNILGFAFACAALAPAVQAVEPAGGELTLDQPRVEFSGGPNPGIYPAGLLGSARCPPAVPVCEEFFLTADLPDNLAQRHPGAMLGWSVGWDATNGEDYDFYLYDEMGYELNQSATFSNPETMAVPAEPGVHTYRLVIVSFQVLTAPYAGVVELQLGAKGQAKSGSLDADAAPATPAAGAMPPVLLLLGLMPWLRGRRP
jgi:hypothetical protein